MNWILLHERDELAAHTIIFYRPSLLILNLVFFLNVNLFLTVMEGLFNLLRNIILYKLHHKEKQEPGALFCYRDQTICFG